jgi:hypothetical protein
MLQSPLLVGDDLHHLTDCLGHFRHEPRNLLASISHQFVLWDHVRLKCKKQAAHLFVYLSIKLAQGK